jgi:flagellar basal body P-ring protein FlgI
VHKNLIFLLLLFILNISIDVPVMRSLGVTTEAEMLKDLCSMGPLMAIGLKVGLAGHGDHVRKKEENGIASRDF